MRFVFPWPNPSRPVNAQAIFAAPAQLSYGVPMNNGAGDRRAASGELLAKLGGEAAPVGPSRALVFDSGLGGLSVLAEIRRLRPDIAIIYAADDAAFPYGRLSEAALIARVEKVMARLIGEAEPDIVVIACSTASTLALAPLRAAYPRLPFVGTVPAIKPAAHASRSGLISVLATRGTVARDYTHNLVRDHAGDCEVTLVGSANLAPIAERIMRGGSADDDEIASEIAPCFVERGSLRTDHVVLACTHFPLIAPWLERLSPWPVAFVDPAPAIARRLDVLIGAPRRGARPSGDGSAIFTSGATPPIELQTTLRHYGLTYTPTATMGLASV
jgi:glutamate racemase